MPTQITCYGGVDEIGGNKILLEDGDDKRHRRLRLFFDFGRSFPRYRKYFDGVFISERPQRGLLDLLALELIPPLPGLLRDDLIPGLDPASLHIESLEPNGRRRKPRQHVELLPEAVQSFWRYWQDRFPEAFRDLRRGRRKPAVDAILISHAHLDHIGDMAYVAPEIPAYGTRLTAAISNVLLDVGGGSGASFLKPRALSPEGYVGADSEKPPLIPRPWHFVDGSPRPPDYIKSWPVDHSLFGAVGYAVETNAGWVAYSGDIRFTGQNGQQTHAFAERLAELRPVALLCEGTRLHTSAIVTEMQVYDNCLRAARKAAGKLVIADFSARNVERLISFKDIAAETGRCLLVQPKDAYLLRAMRLADPERVADVMASPQVKLYADPKAHPAEWEINVRGHYTAVGPLEIQKHPGGYILAFSLADLADMLDLDFVMRGQTEGVYIFSNSQAYDDEQQVDLARLWNWTQRLGLEIVGLKVRRSPRGDVIEVRPEAGYHASGHAGASELAEFVKSVKPKTLIPIHTATPGNWAEILKGTKIKLTLPTYAHPIQIR